MFEAAVNAWKIADLRKKILFTLFIVIIFRLGSAITVPFIDAAAIKEIFKGSLGNEGNVFSFLNIMAGGALEKASILALAISPYITASIVIQLLTVAIPALERMQKEGEEGRKKLNQITRIVTVVLGLIEGYGYYKVLLNSAGSMQNLKTPVITNPHWFKTLVIVMTFTAGSAVVMWLGEKINENGIGNGISIILFFSIVSRGPDIVGYLWSSIKLGRIWLVPFVVLIFAVIIVFIVIMNDSERRIPVQYAKRVVGRKMYGGQSTHLPIKVTMTGVLPIIFASSFTMLPTTIAGFFPNWGFSKFITAHFSYTTWPYAVIYFLLILFFNYFYVSIQYNPIEIANNIKKNGGFVPGIRPGKPTSDFIHRVLSKTTLIGALFLGFIAILPILLSIGFDKLLNIQFNLAIGGTSILIVVGVILETLKQIESQMLMRHYKGFLE